MRRGQGRRRIWQVPVGLLSTRPVRHRRRVCAAMNRAEADAVLATWRELLHDPGDRCKYGEAVRALFDAALHLDAEVKRLEAITRLDVVHLAALGKRNRDLAEMVQREGLT